MILLSWSLEAISFVASLALETIFYFSGLEELESLQRIAVTFKFRKYPIINLQMLWNYSANKEDDPNNSLIVVIRI